MWAFDLTFGLGLALAVYVLLTPARVRWGGLLGGFLLVSPVLRWFTTVFGFPIRLHLSAWVVAVLRITGADASASGNLIRLNGTDFAVDPACIGLQMTGLAALAGLFLVIHLENRTRMRLSLGWLVLVAVGTVVLLLLTNLLRMLALVVFMIRPENPAHDAIGLMCLVFYLLVPLNEGVRHLYQRFGKPVPVLGGRVWMRLALLYSVVGLVAFGTVRNGPPARSVRIDIPAGYAEKQVENGFRQYSKKGVLVYVKPVRTAYSAEHSPTVCWKGSGYVFGAIEEKRINGHLIYVGLIQRGSERLYTAWWFTNGTHQTVGQIDFRWRMLRGDPAFALLNVTAAHPVVLEDAVKSWLNEKHNLWL
ncbi:hypothetical protein GCM10027347_05800 [Larkinella harenae]